MSPILQRGSRRSSRASLSVPAPPHRRHSRADTVPRPGSAPVGFEEAEPRPLTGSLRALAKMSNAELLLHIGRMRHAEVPDIVQHVSDRMSGNGSATMLGHSV